MIVGVDFENTTKEGLEAMLSLKEVGSAEIYVFHNMDGPVFHPKLYLLRNDKDALLMVGSNNLTDYGLFANTEAWLEFRAHVDDPVIKDALAAQQAWAAPNNDLVRVLDADFLRKLEEQGYAPSEDVARPVPAGRRSGAHGEPTPIRLFGGRRIPIPRPPTRFGRTPRPRAKPIATAAAHARREILLMRLRKAGEVDRPTQTQIPQAVRKSPFFATTDYVTSGHDGRRWHFRVAIARGGPNTIKLEVPEMRGLDDPVIRFERVPDGVRYFVFDARSPEGERIMSDLRQGLQIFPPTTTMTKPSKPDQSTWWRFM